MFAEKIVEIYKNKMNEAVEELKRREYMQDASVDENDNLRVIFNVKIKEPSDLLFLLKHGGVVELDNGNNGKKTINDYLVIDEIRALK